MTEKRFTICVDSNDLKSLWDNERTEEEPLLWLTLSDRIGGIDDVCELLNELNDENTELKKESYGNLDGLETYKALYLDLSEKYSNLEADYDELKDENQRLTNKLNNTALELVDNVVSMGKAVEISEMSYNDFLEYRARNNKPMGLQI